MNRKPFMRVVFVVSKFPLPVGLALDSGWRLRGGVSWGFLLGLLLW